MFTLRRFNLPAGTQIKPHFHAARITCTYLRQGQLQDTHCNIRQRWADPVNHTFKAPALIVRSTRSVHSQTALTRCSGYRMHLFLPGSATTLHQAPIVLLTLLSLWHGQAGACTHTDIGIESLSASAIPAEHRRCFIDSLSEAAAHNDVGAQLRLGIALLEGIGAERDSVRGLYWLRRAAESGDPLARNIYQAYKDDSGEGYVC